MKWSIQEKAKSNESLSTYSALRYEFPRSLKSRSFLPHLPHLLFTSRHSKEDYPLVPVTYFLYATSSQEVTIPANFFICTQLQRDHCHPRGIVIYTKNFQETWISNTFYHSYVWLQRLLEETGYPSHLFSRYYITFFSSSDTQKFFKLFWHHKLGGRKWI